MVFLLIKRGRGGCPFLVHQYWHTLVGSDHLLRGASLSSRTNFRLTRGILCSGRTPPAFVPVEGSHTFLGLVPSRTALERGGVYIIFFDLVLAMIVTETNHIHPTTTGSSTVFPIQCICTITYVDRTSVTTMLSCL